MNRLYMSKPVMISDLGNNSDAIMNNLMQCNQNEFIRNRNNILVGRVKLPGEDLYDAILHETINQIRADVEYLLCHMDPEKVGIAIGGCDYHSDAATAAHLEYIKNGTFGSYSADLQNPWRPIEIIRNELGIKGPSFAVASACSSGNVAVVRSADLIISGKVDAMIVGGIDHASDLIASGFDSLSAVSPNTTNPFSANRKGITLGDGVGLFILTRDRIFDFPVAVTGWGESSDGYNMTSPDPDGVSVRKIFSDALSMAGKTPEDVGYINLHGTGTAVNDAMEANAVNAVFGDNVPCSSTKAMTGHTLGSAGALGTCICAMTVASEQPAFIPPHCYDGEYDSRIAPIALAKKGSRGTVDVAMSSAFAFGGSNSVVIVERI